MRSQRTILEELLTQAGVPYTTAYLRDAYQAEPYCGSLLGVAGLLRRYGVESTTLRLSDKTLLEQLPTPFLAETAEGMVLVKEAESGRVTYETEEKPFVSNTSDFEQRWSGVCLIVKASATSAEPGYESHRREMLVRKVENGVWLALTFVLLSCGFFGNSFSRGGEAEYIDSPVALFASSALVNVAGALLAWTLVRQSLQMESRVGRKLCSIFKNGDCHSLQTSGASKIFGRYSFAECGLAFFMVNVDLLCSPSYRGTAMMVLPCFFALALLFSFWSIGYQWFVAKKWCPLCLMVMAVVWLQSAIFIIVMSRETITVVWQHLLVGALLTGLFYLWTLVAVRRVAGLLEKTVRARKVRSELSRLKFRPTVFKALLDENKRQQTEPIDTLLHFGHEIIGSPVITVLSNPYCKPCAEMHSRLKPLVEKSFDVRYVLAPFSGAADAVSRCIIAFYLKYGRAKTWTMLDEWYRDARERGRDFFKGRISDDEARTERVDTEIRKYAAWIERNELFTTPAIFVNGRPLPETYRVEDLLNIVQ